MHRLAKQADYGGVLAGNSPQRFLMELHIAYI
jgi:hypothetical protein